jgi:hypothetical protein
MTALCSTLTPLIASFEQGECRDAHTIYVSTGEYEPLVTLTQRRLVEAGLALPDFDWLAHVDSLQPYLAQPEQVEQASLDDVQKLVTLAVQAEQFNKSLLPYLCSSGFMLSLLKRIVALCA